MSDNIFDRLFELFQSPGPVNWKLGAEVRKSLAGDPEPIEPIARRGVPATWRVAASLRLTELGGHRRVPSGAPLHPVDRARRGPPRTSRATDISSSRLPASSAGSMTISTRGRWARWGRSSDSSVQRILGMQAGSLVGCLVADDPGSVRRGDAGPRPRPALSHRSQCGGIRRAPTASITNR